jgi:serine/threonine-protein kinase
MESAEWDRIQQIYYATLPMTQPERRKFVVAQCQQDPVLFVEVNSLLEAHDSSESFLEPPIFELGLKLIAALSRSDEIARANAGDGLVGKVIDARYLIERELGKGGMGNVYLARDLTLHGRSVVIKFLLEALQRNPYVVKKFSQEVEALSRIDHHGVVTVLGAGKLADGKLYLVMQYVEGVTLRSQITTEGIDFERAASILRQVGNALEAVHDKRIFHRDLKPENIMLQVLKDGTELVKLVDFGIAKVKDSAIGPSTANDVSTGSVAYMSPEQLRGGEKVTAASDIYVMAVIAYEMLTGRRPFNPNSPAHLLELQRAAVRVNPTDLRPNLRTETQAIILRGLAFDARLRYQSAAEFGYSLARSLMDDENKGELKRPSSSLHDHEVASAVLMRSVTWLTGHRPTGTHISLIASTLIVVIVCAGFFFYYTSKIRDGTASAATRSFIYSLTIQRMQDKRFCEESFETTGQDVFENGDKFRLNLSSSAPGYVYLFKEESSESNGSSVTMLYPNRDTNDGSATLGAGQWVRTNWNIFKGNAGTENFWIVWSASSILQLEAAKTKAFTQPGGLVTGEDLDTVKSLLVELRAQVKTRIARDKNSQQTTVRGRGDVLVKMVLLQHR